MLRIDLRTLAAGPVDTVGEIEPSDPLFTDVDFALTAPVRVAGRLAEGGLGRYLWQGRLMTVVAGACRRCLAAVGVPIARGVAVLFAADPSLEDVSTYLLSAHATHLDLRPAVREELILAVPEYLLCRDECRGLCPRCGADLNQGPCDCRPEPDPRWTALRSGRADDERN